MKYLLQSCVCAAALASVLCSTRLLSVDQQCNTDTQNDPVLLEENVDLLVQLKPSVLMKRNYNCSITVAADQSKTNSIYLKGRFLNFRASDSKDPTCSHGAIEISSDEIPFPNPYCSYSLNTPWLGSNITINVYNLNYSVGDEMVFDFLVSPTVGKTTEGCPKDFTYCGDVIKECVNSNLVCNGYKDCDNGADENQCAGSGGLSPGAIVGIVMGSLSPGIAIGISRWCNTRRQKRKLGEEFDETSRLGSARQTV